MKILIIEDEPELRTTITNFPEDDNICEVADSLSKAPDKLTIYKYDPLRYNVS